MTPAQRDRAARTLERIGYAGGHPVVADTTSTVHVMFLDGPPVPWCRRRGRIPHKTRGGRTTNPNPGWREASLRDLADTPLCGECSRRIDRLAFQD